MLYKHDCDKCKYVGSTDTFDVYLCCTSWSPGMIIRYSDDGPDYSSVLDANEARRWADIGKTDWGIALKMAEAHLSHQK